MSGGADVAGAVADVVGKVVKLVQGMIDNDIKVHSTLYKPSTMDVHVHVLIWTITETPGFHPEYGRSGSRSDWEECHCKQRRV